MRFMMIVKANAESEAGLPPSPELMEAVGKLAEEAFQQGIMIDSGGLAPSATGARVRVKGGKVAVVDGPFAEAKELVGGYAIMELPSREAAIEQGRRFMQLHRDVMGPDYEGELEIRQLFGAAELAPAQQ
jgi:hypothetical protein